MSAAAEVHDWSIPEYAAKAHIGTQTLYRLISGETKLPRLYTIQKLAKTLELKVEVDKRIGISQEP